MSEQDELLLSEDERLEIELKVNLPIGYSADELIRLVTIAQLAKVKQHYEQKDRPDREKIKDILLDVALHFEQGDEEQMYGGIKQILALIEQAKREERERIINFIRNFKSGMSYTGDYLELLLPALKGD